MSPLLDKLLIYPKLLIRLVLLLFSIGFGLILYHPLLAGSLSQLENLKQEHNAIKIRVEWIKAESVVIQKAADELKRLNHSFVSLNEKLNVYHAYRPQKRLIEMAQEHNIALRRIESPDSGDSNKLTIVLEVSGSVEKIYAFIQGLLAMEQLIILKQISLKHDVGHSGQLALSLVSEHYIDLPNDDSSAVK